MRPLPYLLALCLLLAGCAARTPLPTHSPQLQAGLPLSLLIQREQGDDRQHWLLVLQAEAEQLRWSLFDPLGVPLARQLLEHGQWRNDGLLPPNAEARELFAALLFALSLAPAQAGYPAGQWRIEGRQRWLAPHWHIDQAADLSLTLDNGTQRYRLRALDPESAR